MANKINIKLILELTDKGMSGRAIAATYHMSHHSITTVLRRAAELDFSYMDSLSYSDMELYCKFFPNKYSSEELYTLPDYEYVHKELSRVGVTLKLLWAEYNSKCIQCSKLPVGYTKFCDDYRKYINANSLTNHLIHKPGIIAEVDWSGSTMQLTDKYTGELIPVYLLLPTVFSSRPLFVSHFIFYCCRKRSCQKFLYCS